MTETSFPFDSSSAYEADWQKIFRPILRPRVIRVGASHIDANLLEVYGDSSGMQVKVKTGSAYVEGFYYNNSTEITKSIAAADPTNPRIDLVVLELDRTDNEILCVVVTGTPAASPVPPTLTETDTLWQTAIAEVAVAASASTITAGNVTDRRVFMGDQLVAEIASSATPTPDCDDIDVYIVTALAAGATFGAPTGAPKQGQSLIIRIKDNGTARTLAWNSVYRGVSEPLPSTTILSKTMYVGFLYNATDSKWDMIALATEP